MTTRRREEKGVFGGRSSPPRPPPPHPEPIIESAVMFDNIVRGLSPIHPSICRSTCRSNEQFKARNTTPTHLLQKGVERCVAEAGTKNTRDEGGPER